MKAYVDKDDLLSGKHIDIVVGRTVCTVSEVLTVAWLFCVDLCRCAAQREDGQPSQFGTFVEAKGGHAAKHEGYRGGDGGSGGGVC